MPVLSWPEAARERDLQRYYRPWLDAQSLVDSAVGIGETGLNQAGYRPEASRDKSLTAFAQLAAFRLDVRRCMVSLIDSHRQYILAEATKTVSLFEAQAERPEDDVWLGNAVLNKTDAVCYHTFSSTYTARDQNGDAVTAECMVVPDCRLDPRFADRDYVKSEPGVRFYAGVPIVTKAGHRIGVYAVSDERPRQGLSAADMRFMQDVAAAVMEHLELAKDSDDRVKGERMVRGLQQFIERSSVADMRDEAGPRMSTMERQTENARLQTLEEDEASGTVTPSTATKHAQRKAHAESDTARIFHRAARIMRQSTMADGVVFFDTSAAGIKGGLYDDSSSLTDSDESVTNNTTDFDTADSTATARRRRRAKVTFDTEHSEGKSSNPEADSKACPVAGLSLRQGVATIAQKDFAFNEAAMERYIHRYPYGKFFNYNEDGAGINSSDEKSERSETDQSDRTATSPNGPPRRRKRRERFIPTEFLKVLPNVRTLIFLPLWDPSSERWVAGGFIWTTQAGRLMSPENELPYLQAFGNSITSEVARLSAQKADRAKTTFIASISHELRSPLHGILGSVEFLRDTVASAYQESLVSSIETCGKTLLDTIDHVLDHAKINKLRNTGARKRRGAEGRTKRLPSDNSILGVTADFDLAQLVEEVCDTVCAGHTFRQVHRINAVATDVDTEKCGVSGVTSEENPTVNDGRVVVGKDNGSVIVSLIVAPYVSWAVRSQPGALRRIVMNLLGNALKYTDTGFVAISLVQSGNTPQHVNLSLTIEDSGRGMSSDFQKTKLFSPFSQEDPFASGTGLGLSIVKQIVESLRGDINVKSTPKVGTQIQVTLQLPVGQSDSAKLNHNLLTAPEALKGASVSILCECDSIGGQRGKKVKESMQNACQGFNMDILDIYDPKLSSKRVDFLLTDTPSLDRLLQESSSSWVNETPLTVVCVCTDTAEKTALEKRLGRQIDALGWTAEVLTQPCGPRKLARALLQCQKRADKANRDRQITRSMTALGLHDHHTLAPPGALTEDQRSISDSVTVQSPLEDSTVTLFGSPSPPPVLPFSSTLTPPQSVTPSSPGPGEANEYFNPRVLLVDDNAINLKLLVVFAKRQKLRYCEAMNGLEAFETYKSEATSTAPATRPFDFILMDISMPIMDGLASTRNIRKFEKERNLPRSHIVALTGLASAQDQQDAQDAGVDMYLVKPVKFADIKRIFGAK
ncbi:hsp90-like protein [Stagonosporopsis vannaccii]|nr:hsp90-like protein [Stagonosporopsis vannaccii]